MGKPITVIVKMNIATCREILLQIMCYLAKDTLDETRSLRELFRTCKSVWRVFDSERQRVEQHILKTYKDIFAITIQKVGVMFRMWRVGVENVSFYTEVRRIDGFHAHYKFTFRNNVVECIRIFRTASSCSLCYFTEPCFELERSAPHMVFCPTLYRNRSDTQTILDSFYGLREMPIGAEDWALVRAFIAEFGCRRRVCRDDVHVVPGDDSTIM